MLKRLIEVALPLKEVSEQSAREKSIRHGHISTLHIWWARRPLAACRAVVFASLIPDPDDPECPDSFAALVNDLLPAAKPTGGTPVPPDTPRNRCLEFIKHLVKWENSNNEELIGKARKLILAAHFLMHVLPMRDEGSGMKDEVSGGGDPRTDLSSLISHLSSTPPHKVLDPFAGGGAIPLEALRLGCEAHAIDLNPVAHLIELCTLVYPQKYGQPNSRPTPDYIKNLEAAHEGKDGDGLFRHLGRTGVPPVKDEKWTRRHLPHWQQEGATYFVTWRCAKSLTLDDADRDTVLSAIRHWDEQRWKVYAAVIMPDHVHVLVEPLGKDDGRWDLGEILHSVKSFSAHEINKANKRKGSVWQDERFDRIVRDEAEFIEKWEYIAKNPIKTGLADTVDDYRWLYLLEEMPKDDMVGQPSRLSGQEDGRDARPTSSDTQIDGIALTRLPLITEAEYQKNPLAADVKFWGHWVLEKARNEIGQFYPSDPDGSVPVAYLWARTVKCPNPACGVTVPLVHQLWLCKKPSRKIALRIVRYSKRQQALDHLSTMPPRPRCDFSVVEGEQIDFAPENGTVASGKAVCQFCGQVADGEYMRSEAKAGRMGQEMMAVVTARSGQTGKSYREATVNDAQDYGRAEAALEALLLEVGRSGIPSESITHDRPSPNSRGLSAVARYGFDNFGCLFNARQSLALVTLGRLTQRIDRRLAATESDYARAVASFLSLVLDWFADKSSTFTRWHNSGEKISGTFARQALPMVWDFAEVNPGSGIGGDFRSGLQWMHRVIQEVALAGREAIVGRASATGVPNSDATIDAVITDPPYYDAVPYSDLSDFFYVWLKRSVGHLYPDLFRTPLTPKQQEVIAYYGNGERTIQKPPEWYERRMGEAFGEIHRLLNDSGICCVMFAHKTTSAWERVIAGLMSSGIVVTSSWPLRTEMKTRMVARDAAALASSVTLVCRKRLDTAVEGYWDDVRDELRDIARERLDFFWQQGIRGADFFISAIGPALSVYGRYAKVTRLTGEEVSVGQFLDEVRGIVTDYALSQILHGAKTGQIDSETRFYVLWKWSYGDAKVAADEAFKLAQALGIDTEAMWDRTGVLEKQGQNVQALTVAKRMRIHNLGEPLGGVEQASGLSDGRDARPTKVVSTHLPTLIDTLHRCCAFRDKGDTSGLSEYLARSGHGRNEKLWTVGQAISEVLPDGDKEKQLLQGLLNQRDKIDAAMAEERLF